MTTRKTAELIEGDPHDERTPAASPGEASSEPAANGVGTQLRTLRLSRGLSLGQVAAGTEISKSFLSLLEAGKSDITIGRLMRLVEFFGVTINDLLPDVDGNADVVVSRPGRLKLLSSPSEGIKDFLLTPDARRAMLPFIGVFSPGGRNSESSTHEGEEFAYVLKGSFVLEIDGRDPIELRSGDSVYFRATLPHAYRNVSPRESRLLCVVTPPHV